MLNFSDTTVVIPALEEEMGIKPTLIELREILKDSCFLIADGGSKDNTVAIAQVLGASTFVQKGKGKGSAISQSLKRVNKTNRFVVFTDADYTYSAKKVKEMISILDKNPNVGMVLGDRFSKKSVIKSLANPFSFGNRLIAWVHWILNGIKLNDPLTGLRVVNYDLLSGWAPVSEGFDIEIELNCYVARMDYRIVEFPVLYRHRLGKKKLGFKDAFTILKRIIKESIL
ncbi:MAG: glycosyltransferase family 2 protein [Candidatus Sifarchaeia archaeon]|jgi:glycosyltransferase involved in cell wall biosynthesis